MFIHNPIVCYVRHDKSMCFYLFYIPHSRVLKSHGKMAGISGRFAHVVLHQVREGGEPGPVDPIHAILDPDDAVHHLTPPDPAQDVLFTLFADVGLES